MGMFIKKVVAKNYRALVDVNINLHENLNIIVGANECGKSTLLEAINLALSGQINGRSIQYELHPFLFSHSATKQYLSDIKMGRNAELPKILIEIYFNDDSELSELKGTNNSLKNDCPGVRIDIEFDESYASEYAEYIQHRDKIKNIPIEYYKVNRYSFAFGSITSRSIPTKVTLIDASTIRHNIGASKYVVDIIKDTLSESHQAQLSLSYRQMKDSFVENEIVKNINDHLCSKTKTISQKNLSVALDTTTKSNWETGIMPHLDEIPMPLVGKGEQSSVKIKLAIESAAKAHIFLIEEPENHLSYPNLNKLLNAIREQAAGRQLVVTTHSSFVLNKLGVENVLLFDGQKSITLNALPDDTKDYFLKLPGYDTLRLILSRKAILVEGPSDELVVQKAFHVIHNVSSSLEHGVDVISVNSLAFERFLDIANILEIDVSVITDNDGSASSVESKYSEYIKNSRIKIFFDKDEAAATLEDQILKANSLDIINSALGKNFKTSEALLSFMKNNKTTSALSLFNSKYQWEIPRYIHDAIK